MLDCKVGQEVKGFQCTGSDESPTWKKLHNIHKKMNCNHCANETLRFVNGLHDMVNMGLGEELVKISENFQRALGGGLLLSEQELTGGGGFVGGTLTEQTLSTIPGEKFPAFLKNAFSAFDPGVSNKNKRSTTKKPDPENIFNVAKAFTPQTQLRRISQQQKTAALIGKSSGTAFGGFESAIKQESALQIAIAKSRQLNPQFFKI